MKDLRDVAGLSFACVLFFPFTIDHTYLLNQHRKASQISHGRKKAKINLKYVCTCLAPEDASCNGAVIVRVEDDDSHPIEVIKGQKIWVEINHW